MEKKNIGLGVAALAVGAGAVALAAKNHKNNVKNEVKKAAANAPEQEYRNTERGKNEKNSKRGCETTKDLYDSDNYPDHSSYSFGRRVLFYDADKSSIPKDKRHEQ